MLSGIKALKQVENKNLIFFHSTGSSAISLLFFNSLDNMRYKDCCLCTSLFYLLLISAKGQDTNIYSLPTVRIETYRQLNILYRQRLVTDSLFQKAFRNTTLTELLQAQGLYAIRTYGNYSLATLNFRGSASTQNNILWNGISLLSNMNGVSDLSLLPVHFFEEITIELGSNSAYWGSGSIGGSLLLNSQPNLSKKGFNVNFSLQSGSFGQHQTSGLLAWKGKKITNQLKFFYNQAQNNFPFRNTSIAGNPWQIQTNAFALSKGILNETYLVFAKRQALSFHLWLQEAFRQIPPILSVPVARAIQKDKVHRVLLNYRKEPSNLIGVQLKFFYQLENIYYEDPLANIFSDNRAQTFWLESEFRQKIFFKSPQIQMQVLAGASGQFQKAQAQGYGENKPQQWRSFIWSSLQLEYHYKNEQIFCLGLKARMESIDARIYAPSGQISLQYQNAKIRITSLLARSFRFPTFNDLYWKPGGNLALKPETSWNFELLSDWKNKILSLTQFQLQIGTFSNWVNDWIIWLPAQNYWQPQNLQKVWARGAEVILNISQKIQKLTLQGGGKYTFCKSTNEKVRFANDHALGKQLIYTPLHTAQAEITAVWKYFTIRYYQTFTGIRFISSDNHEYLPAFTLGNILFTFQNSSSKLKPLKNLYLHYRISNLFNASYMVIAQRPMPGRQHEFCIQVSF
ncbi:MAG: TonB-dependent receptor [Bacteroidia bacterium]|nr:TonB-dependent receptor [Bacteroidia bacterium]MDW8157326.1 TonB-dependent receptor [Bacteroidia bacterium]